MADDGKVVINLTTGHEDADKVTVAFLVASAALTKGKRVAMFLTKEAVRLGLPGYADAIESLTAGKAGKQTLVQSQRRRGGFCRGWPAAAMAARLSAAGRVA